MIKKTVFATVLTLLLIAFSTLTLNVKTVKAQPQTIIVPDNYPTIQEAINAASDGDTVFVKAGTYYEPSSTEAMIIVNKSISLIGEDKGTTIIDAKHNFTPVIQIMANDITIRGFTIQNSGWVHCLVGGGIFISGFNGTVITDNIIRDTQYGVNLYEFTCNNLITENIFINNGNGVKIEFDTAVNNTLYHNNFANNTAPVAVHTTAPNTWDNGYPSGGNYWSDYIGVDLYSGPYQNETGSDGIGDTPYVMKENNTDRYPLIRPWKWPLVGDVNNNFIVDMKDVALVAKAFGSSPGHERWNPIADITGSQYLVPDNKVDMKDVGLIAKNFGKTYP
jgi:nitrous oxidase accessory protein NosD